MPLIHYPLIIWGTQTQRIITIIFIALLTSNLIIAKPTEGDGETEYFNEAESDTTTTAETVITKDNPHHNNRTGFKNTDTIQKDDEKSQKNKPHFGNFGDSCDKSSDCRRSASLKCVERKCACQSKYTKFDTEKQKCLSVVGSPCTLSKFEMICVQNAECSNGGHGGRSSKVCTCVNGYEKTTEDLCNKIVPSESTDDDYDEEEDGESGEATLLTTSEPMPEIFTTLTSQPVDIILPQESTTTSSFTTIAAFAENDTTTTTLIKEDIILEATTKNSNKEILDSQLLESDTTETDILTFTNSQQNAEQQFGVESFSTSLPLPLPIPQPPYERDNGIEESTTPTTTPYTTTEDTSTVIYSEPSVESATTENTPIEEQTAIEEILPQDDIPTSTQESTVNEKDLVLQIMEESTTSIPITEEPMKTFDENVVTEFITIPQNVSELLETTIPWANYEATTLQPEETEVTFIPEKLRLGEMCNEDKRMSCGENVNCVEIGKSSDFVCMCRENYIAAEDSDVNCMEKVKDTTMEAIEHTSTEITEVTTSPSAANNQSSIKANITFPKRPKTFLKVGESCVISKSGSSNERDPEVLTSCVRNAECITIYSLFKDFNVCQCKKSFARTVKGKCVNYSSSSVGAINSNCFPFSLATVLILLTSLLISNISLSI